MTKINCTSQCFFQKQNFNCLFGMGEQPISSQCPISIPLITLENQRFSANDIRRYKIGTVVWNWLKVSHYVTLGTGNSNWTFKLHSLIFFFFDFLPSLFLKRLLANRLWKHTLMKGNFFGVYLALKSIMVLAVSWFHLWIKDKIIVYKLSLLLKVYNKTYSVSIEQLKLEIWAFYKHAMLKKHFNLLI